MNVFEAVKQSVTTRQAAEQYGLDVKHNGMTCCPFHEDKNPSMKVDNRFHCFGCGEDGDVIDFVGKLFSLSPKEAAQKIAFDFGVAYDNAGRYVPKKPSIIKRIKDEQYKNAERKVFGILTDYYKLLRDWQRDLAPHSPEEKLDPRFVEALQNIGYIDYLCDLFITGTREDKADFISAKGKEMLQLEKRIAELTADKGRAVGACGRRTTTDEIS